MLAAVFVTRARRVIEPEEYFDEDEVSLLLTKNAAVLLRECTEFLAPYLAAAKLTGEVRKDLDIGCGRRVVCADAVLAVQHPVAEHRHARRHRRGGLRAAYVVNGFAEDRSGRR